MKPKRIALTVVCALAAAFVGTGGPVQAAPRWAPASSATIHPGVQTSAGGARCTANFVFYDSRSVYLGQAASCLGRVGTKVDIQGASRPGTVVYNSLQTGMHEANDFALIRLDGADKGRVNPSIPFWGGPTNSGGRSSLGNRVYSFGSATKPSGTTDQSPKVGIDTTAFRPNSPTCDCSVFRPEGEGDWTRYAHMVLTGSNVGAPVLDAKGRALGIQRSWVHDLATGITDLSKAIEYLKAHTALDAIQLAKGTEPFLPV